jgi:hypothetical protein
MDITETTADHVRAVERDLGSIARVTPYNLDLVVRGFTSAIDQLAKAVTEIAAEVQGLQAGAGASPDG